MSAHTSCSPFQSEADLPPHPAGIVLRRHGYYTLPSMEELADITDKDGVCVVENFVVGREGFGNVLFLGKTDVTGMNLDEIGTLLVCSKASAWHIRNVVNLCVSVYSAFPS